MSAVLKYIKPQKWWLTARVKTRDQPKNIGLTIHITRRTPQSSGVYSIRIKREHLVVEVLCGSRISSDPDQSRECTVLSPQRRWAYPSGPAPCVQRQQCPASVIRSCRAP